MIFSPAATSRLARYPWAGSPPAQAKTDGQPFRPIMDLLTSGRTLHATRGYIPASIMKLLTSTAALSILGPDHALRTSVLRPQTRPDHSGRWRRSLPCQEGSLRLPCTPRSLA